MKNLENFFANNDAERLAFYEKKYRDEGLSWRGIGELIGANHNKVRRDAQKLGIKSRDKSQAQKVALEAGRSEHPSEGKERSEETKAKISESMGEAWDNVSDAERRRRADLAKKQWEEMPEDKKALMRKNNIAAIQETSKTGSQFEKYLAEGLTKAGYTVLCHREHLLKNGNLHLDLFLPSLKIVVEVDGPSHSKNVWGSQALKRTKQTDRQKDALVLLEGLVLIRVAQTQRISQRFMRRKLESLLETIDEVRTKFPEPEERLIRI
jgi:very-short-patch-repair endonuclease